MNAVDTNVLLYAHDPRAPVKQSRAVSLIASLNDGAWLWQVACEYIAASRKLAAFGLDTQQALADLKRLRSVWTPIPPTWVVLDTAERLMATGTFILGRDDCRCLHGKYSIQEKEISQER